MTPLNQEHILKAAKASGKVIPVQIYLYSHYENPYGYNFTTSKQLMDLVSSLDTQLVKVVGECVGLLLLLLTMLVIGQWYIRLSETKQTYPFH